MKILFVTPESPSPYGGGQRMLYMIKHLWKNGLEIHLLSLAREDDFFEALKDWCSKISLVKKREGIRNRLKNLFLLRAYTYFPEFESQVRQLNLSQYDLIHVHKFQMAEYFREVKNVPVLIDLWACGLGGALAEAFYESNIVKKLVKITRIPRYSLADRRYFRSFDYFFVVSKEALDYVHKRGQGKKVYIVPQGIEQEKFSCAPEVKEVKNPNLIFTGDMSFFQNIDTVKYLAKKIYPLIKKKIKTARLFIVGKEPTKEILELAKRDSSIVVTGFVKNISEYLSKSAVFVAPIRTGIGMRTKIVEAMAWGLPVVTTRLTIEGIEGKDGKDFVLAQTPQEFADSVTELLENPEKRKAIAQTGKNFIQEKYRWEIIIPKAIIFYQEIIENFKKNHSHD